MNFTQEQLLDAAQGLIAQTERAECLIGVPDDSVIRFEVEIADIGVPREVQGRKGDFYKMTVLYRLWIEIAGREHEVIEGEMFRRDLRLNPRGQVVGTSGRIGT